RKKALEDFLDREIELESVFSREGNTGKLAAVKPYDAEFFFVRQREMKGTGHALLSARPFVGTGPVVVAYPDDIHMGEPPLALQLVRAWEKTGCSVLATIHDPPEINRYGILDLAADNLHVKDMAEKPAPGTEPSREVSIGRYLYTPDFFDYLEEGWRKHLAGPNPEGEYYHLYALKKLMEQNKVVYKRTEGLRLDTGEPEGYLRAFIAYAAGIPELRRVLVESIKGLS
ncbi:MAG: UTP--glucose-1-phosphate uridylyltransferase, partial [Spirochaetales bacterium]